MEEAQQFLQLADALNELARSVIRRAARGEYDDLSGVQTAKLIAEAMIGTAAEICPTKDSSS